MDDREQDLAERLMRYCAIDTQSDGDSETTPSTDIQLDLSRLLADELTAMGAEAVQITDYGTVLATIPGNAPGPTIGFVAHVDTAPQFNAAGVKPRLISRYNGGEITYPDNPDLILSPEAEPYLATRRGDDIITASGTTLLGADDKAGVAVIMATTRALLANPNAKRPTLRIAFTPDEEIGRGVHARLPADLGADFAYTFDGGAAGEIEYETFSADGAEVRIKGVSIHPGLSKDKLVSAITLAGRFLAMLPQATMTPDTTDGRLGFIHATDMSGDAAEMRLRFIIRDFEREGLKAKGALLKQLAEALAATEPRAQVSCTITRQYRNMRYWLEQDMTPVTLAQEAAASLGIEVNSVPIRGGTDGSRLTEMGVPCPNLFTGMQAIHGPLEWISVQDMARAADLMAAIAARAVKT